MGNLPYDVGLKTTAWLIAMCYIAVIGTIFIIKSRGAAREVPSQRAMHRAIGLFFYFYNLARIFFILSDYERDPHGETDLYFQFVALSYIVSIIGFLNIIIVFEKYIIKPGKFIMAYIIVTVVAINAVMLIFFPSLIPIVRYINYALLYTEVMLLLLLYLYLFRKTSGVLKRNALISLIGLILMASASLLETDALISSGIVQPYYSPIFFAIGASIFAYGQRKI